MLMRGSGLGSIFAGLFSKVIPFISSIFKSGGAKKILKKAHKSAVKAGLNLAEDAAAGKNLLKAAKQRINRFGGKMIENFNQDARPAITKGWRGLRTRMKAKTRDFVGRTRARARRWASRYSLDDMFD